MIWQAAGDDLPHYDCGLHSHCCENLILHMEEDGLNIYLRQETQETHKMLQKEHIFRKRGIGGNKNQTVKV
jgi:hypothetical protein